MICVCTYKSMSFLRAYLYNIRFHKIRETSKRLYSKRTSSSVTNDFTLELRLVDLLVALPFLYEFYNETFLCLIWNITLHLRLQSLACANCSSLSSQFTCIINDAFILCKTALNYKLYLRWFEHGFIPHTQKHAHVLHFSKSNLICLPSFVSAFFMCFC